MRLPTDAHVEPTREVLRQIYMGFGSMSFHDQEPTLLKRAHELAAQGWLEAGAPYPCAGRSYTQFKAAPRLDVSALKDI